MTILALIAAVLHVFFFYLESIAWGKPKTNEIFGVRSQGDAETNRVLAFNQGFYNLFLAMGIFWGVAETFMGNQGSAVIHFCMASILGAGVVLYISTKNVRGALIQAGPPLVYFLISFFS